MVDGIHYETKNIYRPKVSPAKAEEMSLRESKMAE